jgi:phosphate-selective porin OprO and OprP
MHRFSIHLAALLAALTLTVAPPGAAAQTKEKLSAEEYQRRIDKLEKDVQDLKKDTRKLEVTNEETAKLKPVAGYQEGFFVQSQDGNYKIKLGGYTHFDGRFFLGNASRNQSQFVFRRVRLDLTGTVAKYFDFRVMPDFAGSSLRLFDAYVEAKYLPWAKLRVGKFKPPIGIERLQSATALPLAERALPTNLVPSRDLGIQVGSDLWLGVFSYYLGVFNGAADGGTPDIDVSDDKDFAGRVFTQPFKQTSITPLQEFGFGLSGSYGNQQGSIGSPDLPAYRTFGQATFFSYRTNSPATADGTAVAIGDHWRVSPHAYWYWGPFGALGEYVLSTQDVRLDRTTGTPPDTTTTTNHREVGQDAWQFRAEYVLTGENASFKGVVPAKPFDPFAGEWGWGAAELVARYGQLEIDPDTFSNGFADPNRSARRADEFAVGLNWFLNRNIMFAFDYAHTAFDGGAAGGGDRKSEDVILSRVQLLL